MSGKGSQFADHVRSTPGDWSFAVLVEIKRADTPLLLHRKYREGTWGIHAHLADAVAQAQSNVMSLVRHSSTREGHQDEVEKEMSFADPEGILLVGTLGQLESDVQRETFHRFRRNLWNPRVITFDELLARARFQVEQLRLRTAGNDGDVANKTRASGAPPATRPGSHPLPAFAVAAAFDPLAEVFDHPEDDEEPPDPDDEEPPDEDYERAPGNQWDDDLPF